MTKPTVDTLKKVLLIVVLIVVFYYAWRQIFKVMGISTVDMPTFKYNAKSSTKKSDWYNYIAPYAKVIGEQYGIPWQAICVQTALESGWGKSSLLRKYNNFGGIKSVKGDDSISMATGEVINGQKVTITDGFAVWNTPYLGLVGYAKFFRRNKRYKEALKYPHDPYHFISEIKKAGYATSTNYISVLHGMLKNDLKA